MALPPGPLDLAPSGRADLFLPKPVTLAVPGSAIFVGSWGPAHSLRRPGFVCWTPDFCLAPVFLQPQSSRREGSGLGLVGSALSAGNNHAQAGGIWFGALPACHPHPMPGQSRAAAAASLHFEAWVGDGECWVLPGPCLSRATWGLSPMPALWKGPGLLFPLPLCSRELGDDACLAPIFLLASSLPLFLCNGSPFWHLLPCPLP